MDNINENLDSQNQEAEVEQPLEELALPESVETVDATEMQKLIEQNKKLYARAKKAEEKAKAAPKADPIDKPVSQKSEQVDELDVVLALQAEGKTPAEIKTLREYSRRMNKPIHEVAADPILKAGLEALRKQEQTQSAIPSPSKRSFTYKSKPLDEVILTGSPADVQAALEQRVASIRVNKTNE